MRSQCISLKKEQINWTRRGRQPGYASREVDRDTRKVKRRPVPESLADRTNKYVIHSVVGTELFPRVKFVDHVNDLEYSCTKNTICDFVLICCKLSLHTSEAVFWEKAKTWVRHCIACHGSDKAAALRYVFHGKSFCFDLCPFDFLCC